MKKFYFILIIQYCLYSNLIAQTTLISYGSEWDYHLNQNEPAPQGGLNWNEFNYDSGNGNWNNGSAQLGYGDGDEATILDDGILTAYFRHEFNVLDPNLFTGLDLALLYDDGAVVYLNGAEVWRVNMPAGSINYATFTTAASNDNALANTNIANSIVAGTNIIAIEIHQRSAGSSDISFDFEMKTVGDVLPLLNFGSTWNYYDNEQAPPSQGGGEWFEQSYVDNTWDNGAAHLGYGDGDEVTFINENTLTGYFRHTFNVTDNSLFGSLELNLIYDDGAIVYLNGTEIWRVNMPATGPVNYGDLTSGSGGDNALISKTISNLLQNGSNLIAVEIHQVNVTSSDISFDFQLIGRTLNAPANIVRGPYLQKSSFDRVTVKWRTDLPTASQINYGTTFANLDLQVTDNALTTEHEMDITGLNSSSVYYYEIGDNINILKSKASDLYFKTSPNIATDAPYRFWVLGDPGTANNNQRAVRDAYYGYVGTDHTDGILFLGDNAYNDGTDDQYQNAMFQNMYEEKMKNTIAWSCIGNHDAHSANSNAQTGPYYDIFSFPTNAECGGIASFTEAYYSFDYGNIHFIILDSYGSDRSIGGPMYNWAQSDIQNTTQEWIVALWHHPAYTKGSHDSDTESLLVQMRERFLPMLESNGVDLILSGHSHSYERSYFLNGHYGNSDSFDQTAHTIGYNGFGDGQIDGDGAYNKTMMGSDAGKGAVYITAGSSGKISNAPIDHEAMYYAVVELGSCVLEVHSNRLDIKFVRETGAVEDYFTIYKAADCNVNSFLSAIDCASSGDTIMVDPSVFSDSIMLNSRPAYIEKDLYIIANPSDQVIISAENIAKTFEIEKGYTVYIQGITIKSGTDFEGRGILNHGNLNLKNVTVLEHSPAINSGNKIKNSPSGSLIIQGAVEIKN